MISIARNDAQQRTIELTDELMEKSDVVEAVLNVCFHLEADLDDGDLIGYIIDFATKWEISIVNMILRQQIRLEAGGKRNGLACNALLGANKLEDYEAIQDLLHHKGHLKWAPQEPKEELEERRRPSFPQYDPTDHLANVQAIHLIPDGLFLEPGTMDARDNCQIRPMVHWAIGRAIYKVAGPRSGKLNWEKIGTEFKKLMDQACKSGWRGQRDLVTSRPGPADEQQCPLRTLARRGRPTVMTTCRRKLRTLSWTVCEGGCDILPI